MSMRRVLFSLLGLAFLVLGVHNAAPASAAGIPFIDICNAQAPMPHTPTDGLTGLLTSRPNETQDFSPQTLFSSGGLAGTGSNNYDLGCAQNPGSYSRMARSDFDNTITNGVVGFGTTITALTDAVDRRAWEPGWISAFLTGFTAHAIDVVNREIWIPLLGLGLLCSSAFLVWQSREGNPSKMASAAAWVVLVLVIGGVVMSKPLWLAQTTQAGGNAAVAALNNSPGTTAADATTDEVAEFIQYKGWLRRTFGSEDSAVAKRWGPELLENSRVSWRELDSIERGDTTMAKVVEAKQKRYEQIAKEVKEADPHAYRYLQGDPSVISAGTPLLEGLFALFANLIRLVCALLMVSSLLLLVLVGIVWIVASPILVTPAGMGAGRMLLDSLARSVGYVAAAAVAGWLYTIFLESATAPGMSGWWSVLLLFLGTIIWWTVLRPDRKMLSLLSMGRVDGTGAVMKALKIWAIAHFGGKIAGAAAAEAARKDDPEPTPAEENVARPLDVVYGTVIVPPDPAPPAGEVDAGPRIVVGTTLPSGEAAYQRGEGDQRPASPPPPGSVGEVEVYRRPPAEKPFGFGDDQMGAAR